jgi:hypothetical protein
MHTTCYRITGYNFYHQYSHACWVYRMDPIRFLLCVLPEYTSLCNLVVVSKGVESREMMPFGCARRSGASANHLFLFRADIEALFSIIWPVECATHDTPIYLTENISFAIVKLLHILCLQLQRSSQICLFLTN